MSGEAAEGRRCGAGHVCCNVPEGPPMHDHFLSPDDCPSCRLRSEADLPRALRGWAKQVRAERFLTAAEAMAAAADRIEALEAALVAICSYPLPFNLVEHQAMREALAPHFAIVDALRPARPTEETR